MPAPRMGDTPIPPGAPHRAGPSTRALSARMASRMPSRAPELTSADGTSGRSGFEERLHRDAGPVVRERHELPPRPERLHVAGDEAPVVGLLDAQVRGRRDVDPHPEVDDAAELHLHLAAAFRRDPEHARLPVHRHELRVPRVVEGHLAHPVEGGVHRDRGPDALDARPLHGERLHPRLGGGRRGPRVCRREDVGRRGRRQGAGGAVRRGGDGERKGDHGNDGALHGILPPPVRRALSGSVPLSGTGVGIGRASGERQSPRSLDSLSPAARVVRCPAGKSVASPRGLAGAAGAPELLPDNAPPTRMRRTCWRRRR